MLPHSIVMCISKTKHLRTYVAEYFWAVFNKKLHTWKPVREFHHVYKTKMFILHFFMEHIFMEIWKQ
jgi:hypothetical protein